MISVLAVLFAGMSGFGSLAAVAGLRSVQIFMARPAPPAPVLPPITVMKPLCGPEPGLEEALASFCVQDVRGVQLVFGVQDPQDPAVAIVRRLAARFAEHDITLVVDATPHGRNRKVANLINMLPAARHDMLVFADSDLHVAPDYLRHVAAALLQHGTGLVTALYGARPVVGGLAARLGASHITNLFLPGALLARAMRRQDCLGTTMALTRQTLERVGGLEALADELADDNVLGQRVRGLGLAVTLAATVPVIGVQDQRLRDLWLHELRWARTISALAPVAYACSALQYSIIWAVAAGLCAGFAPWSILIVVAAWAARAACARSINRALGLVPAPSWLLPLRDALSVAELFTSFWGGRVVWRGQAMRAERRRRPVPIQGLAGHSRR